MTDTLAPKKAEKSATRSTASIFAHFEDVLGATILIITTGVVALGVFTRFVIGDALSWSQSIAEYGLIWLTMVGSVIAMRRNEHMRADVIGNMLSEKSRRIYVFITDYLSAGVLLIFGWFALQLALNSITRTSFHWLTWQYIYAIIPICCFGMAIYSAVNAHTNKPALSTEVF